MRTLLPALGLLALLSDARATNVVLVVVDDLGADRVGRFLTADEIAAARFLPDTPTLDELGEAGLSFTRAWANPICSPSRATLLTGAHPFRHGLGANVAAGSTQGLDPANLVIAEDLAAAGWATAAFGKWHLGEVGSGGTADWVPDATCPDTTPFADDLNPLRHGFDAALVELQHTPDAYDDWDQAGSAGAGRTEVCTQGAHHDEVVVEGALDWIAARHDPDTGAWEPFFVYLALKSVHTDAEGTPSALDENDLPPSCGVSEACLVDGVVDSCGDADGDGVDDEQRRLHRAMIECADATVATLLSGMDDLGALDDTLVVFLGDNGTSSEFVEAPFDQSASFGKGTVYESGLRVPLIVAEGAAWRAVHEGRAPTTTLITAPGRLVARPVLAADLYDTLAETLGVTPTGVTDGESFVPCFANTTSRCGFASTRAVYAEDFALGSTGALRTGHAALRKNAYKLLFEYRPASRCLYPTLYDLSADPYETTDVYTTVGAATVTGIKRDVARLGVSWLPRNSRGQTAWCR